MKIQVPSISIKNEVIEVIDKKSNEKSFLLKNNDTWIKITEDEYNKILRGN